VIHKLVEQHWKKWRGKKEKKTAKGKKLNGEKNCGVVKLDYAVLPNVGEMIDIYLKDFV